MYYCPVETNDAGVALVEEPRSLSNVADAPPPPPQTRPLLSRRLESALACPRCLTRLNALRCVTCDFFLDRRQGLLVCGPERNHAFSNYSAECGVPQYTTTDLVEHEYYLRFLAPGPSALVLDCGGGDANASALWARRNPGGELVVADMDGFALRKAVDRRLPNLIPLQTPVLSLPFLSGSVDVVFTTFMVEHMYDWELSPFYLEAKRVLKPGGSLIVQSDAAFFDKFIHPVLRLIKGEGWRTSQFLDRWRTHVRSLHHHNLKTGEEQARIIAEHGFFIQGMEVPLLFSNRVAFAAAYEVLGGILPAWLLNRFLGTSYTIVAAKREDNRTF